MPSFKQPRDIYIRLHNISNSTRLQEQVSGDQRLRILQQESSSTSQTGLTLNKVVIDIGKNEFCSGLTFVACSRVRQLNDLLFAAPFSYLHLHNISNSTRLQERLSEHQHLYTLHQHQGNSSTSQTLTLQSTPTTNNQSPISSHPTTSYCTTHIMLHDTAPSPPKMLHRPTPSSPLLTHDTTPSLSHKNTPSPPIISHTTQSPSAPFL